MNNYLFVFLIYLHTDDSRADKKKYLFSEAPIFEHKNQEVAHCDESSKGMCLPCSEYFFIYLVCLIYFILIY
jgi:hypothetical protein